MTHNPFLLSNCNCDRNTKVDYNTMAANTVIAFDLYGTLLSTESIAKELATHFGEKAPGLAGLWRRYQLEYTWRLNSMSMPVSSSNPSIASDLPLMGPKTNMSPSQTSPAIPLTTLWQTLASPWMKVRLAS